MSHKVSYYWFRKTQVIPEYVVFYNVWGYLLGDVTVGESLDGENAPNPTTESRFHLPANTQREIL